MWIEWTISIRWVGLLICARVGLFWVGNINGTKFPDTARLQPIPPPMISTEKRRKKFQTRLRNGCMTAGRLVGWLGGEGAAFTKMHRSDKITSSTLLFLRSNRYWKVGTQNWDWRFFKTLQALGVPRSKRNSIRGARNPKLGRALKIPHWAQICHGFPSGCPDVLPRIGMIWPKASVFKRH